MGHSPLEKRLLNSCFRHSAVRTQHDGTIEVRAGAGVGADELDFERARFRSSSVAISVRRGRRRGGLDSRSPRIWA